MNSDAQKKPATHVTLESTLNVDDRRVDVMLSMMNSVREHIREWSDRTYATVTWSSGLLLGITAYLLTET